MSEQQPNPESLLPFTPAALDALDAATRASKALAEVVAKARVAEGPMTIPGWQVFQYELDGTEPLCVPREAPDNGLSEGFAGRVVLARTILMPVLDPTRDMHPHFHLYPYNVRNNSLVHAGSRKMAMVALDAAAFQSGRLTIAKIRQARSKIRDPKFITSFDLFSAWQAQHPDDFV